jgi:hypothetical protein
MGEVTAPLHRFTAVAFAAVRFFFHPSREKYSFW